MVVNQQNVYGHGLIETIVPRFVVDSSPFLVRFSRGWLRGERFSRSGGQLLAQQPNFLHGFVQDAEDLIHAFLCAWKVKTKELQVQTGRGE
jgi:hypothetical protein